MRITTTLALLTVLAGCGSDQPSRRPARREPAGERQASAAPEQAAAPKPATLTPTTGTGGSPVDWDKAGVETLETLKDLIRYKTYVADDLSEDSQAMDLVRALADRFAAEGISAEVIPGVAKGRGNLVARIKGDGSKKPLLLLAHLDTVWFEREKWATDPLAAAVKEDGYVYGRGAIDDKGMAATSIVTMLLLARQKPALARDVILLLECDEEIGGPSGMALVAAKFWDRIDAELAINEGGEVLIREDGSVDHVAVQNAEKTPYNILLTAKGTTGHGSVPLPDNPVLAIGRALSRISAWRSPVKLNDTTRRFFAGLAKVQRDPVQAQILRNLVSEDPAVAAGAAAYVSRRDPIFASMLRNSVSPTILKGGAVRNVIPTEASVNLNVRLLPGEDAKAFLEELRQVVAEPAVEIGMVEGIQGGEGPMSPPDTDLFRAIESVAGEMTPGATTVPYMSTGATDSTDLRRRGVTAYGLNPMPITEEDLRRMHGHNERVRVSSVRFSVEFLYKIVTRVAGAS